MLLLALAWIVAIVRPSYVMLFAFGAAVIAFAMPAFLATTSNEERIGVGIVVAINLVILYGVGIPIVALRLWMRSRKSSAERNADQELERLRTRLAEREIESLRARAAEQERERDQQG
jgi:thiol:disulfide interchange protein